MHWRLTFFYTVALAILFGLLGWYLDRQLWNFAMLQMDDRVTARAATLMGTTVASPRGTIGIVRTALPRFLQLPPGTPPSPSGGPPRPGFAARVSTSSLAALAGDAAQSDTGNVTTTILSPDGEPVLPSQTPPRWHPEPNLAPGLLSEAIQSGRAAGPELINGPTGQYVVLEQPLGGAPGARVIAQLSTPASDLDGLLRSFRIALALGLAALIGAAVGLGRPLARLALRPLRHLTSTVAYVSPDRLAERVPVPEADDELRELALTFNQMLERIDGSVQAQQQSEAQLRRFVGDASHELRSPLTALSGYVDLLLQPQGTVETAHVAPRMRRELDRMSHLVGDLLALTRLDAAPSTPARAVPLELSQVTEEAVESMTLVAAPRKLVFDAPDGDVWIKGDRDGLERALQNLVANAIQHTEPNGLIQVKLAKTDHQAELAVVDDGEGIPPEHLGHIFDRFYRVDEARSRGSGNAGLGLAIVKAIIQQHAGSVDVKSEPNKGSTFIVHLPLVAPATV